jgi:Ca-activated chloride channel family protein
MRRRAATLAVIICCGLAAAARAQTTARPETAGEDEVLRVETTLVTVPVSVADSDGRYVAGLGREDFRLFEDGVEQEIVHFAPAERPFTVALLLDVSDSLRFRLADVQEAAVAFVERLRPEDQVMVLSFSSRLDVLCEPTGDRELLRRAIRSAATHGGTRVYDAVDFVVRRRLEQGKGGRNALIIFTDGLDTGSFHATREGTLRHLEESGVLAYAVQYSPEADAGGRFRDAARGGTGAPGLMAGGAGTDPTAAARATIYLRDLSRRTGGRHFRADNLQSLGRAFGEIAAELRQQYSLGYYPKEPARAAPQRRRIKVRVSRPKLSVRARSDYVLPARAPTGRP